MIVKDIVRQCKVCNLIWVLNGGIYQNPMLASSSHNTFALLVCTVYSAHTLSNQIDPHTNLAFCCLC